MKPLGRTVKLSLTTQQGNDEDAPILPESVMTTGFKNYYAIYKARPPPEEEITVSHFSAIQYCLGNGLPPWADFGLLGPNGARTFQKLKFHGLQIQPDGTFLMTEFKGPSNFKTWDQSYAVLMCGLIFLGHSGARPLGGLQGHDPEVCDVA